MNLNGGYGDVEAAQKNIPLMTNSTEGIAAIRNANDTDVWIIVHKLSSYKFAAFPVTGTGIGTPTISTIGPFRNPNSIIGQIKPSHNGSRIAVTITFAAPQIELFDFNASTGEITNELNLSPSFLGISGAYGIEFSPNDSILYHTSFWMDDYVYQYVLTTGNVLTLDQGTGNYQFSDLQLASDHKIYMARNGFDYLSVINEPDIAGTGCNYIANGLTLAAGSYCLNGLPNQPAWIYDTVQVNPCGQLTLFSASSTEVCEKFCIDFFDQSANNPTSWLWLFPGGVPSSSTDQNPTNICYQFPGLYDVTLITTNTSGADTLTLSGYVTVNSTPPFPTIDQNGYTLTSSTANSYQWQFNSADIPGATNQSYDVQQSGYYTVVISDINGCFSSSTIYVLIDGIETGTDKKDVLIYPNPSDGHFVIEFPNSSKYKDASVEIYNAFGERINSSFQNVAVTDGSSQLTKIEINGWQGGVFIVEIKSINFSLQKKLVVVKGE